MLLQSVTIQSTTCFGNGGMTINYPMIYFNKGKV